MDSAGRVHAVIACLLAITSWVFAADGPTPYPTRKEDWPGVGAIRVFHWMSENRRTFWREREQVRGGMVFAGDSLTAQWHTLQQDFPGLRIANRGIGGDVSRGLLFRFQEDVLDLQPRAVVILIGTNDLTARQVASATLRNVAAMLDSAARASPAPFVVLCTVPPSAKRSAPVDAAERSVLNDGLRKLAEQHPRTAVADLNSAVATPAGTPDPQYFRKDLLHLSAAGHARWRELLLPVLHDAGVLPP